MKSGEPPNSHSRTPPIQQHKQHKLQKPLTSLHLSLSPRRLQMQLYTPQWDQVFSSRQQPSTPIGNPSYGATLSDTMTLRGPSLFSWDSTTKGSLRRDKTLDSLNTHDLGFERIREVTSQNRVLRADPYAQNKLVLMTKWSRWRWFRCRISGFC